MESEYPTRQKIWIACGSAEKSLRSKYLNINPPKYTPINGGHNSYTFTGNASQLSYGPFKFSGESDSIKALRKEALV